jgi:transcriptional regulator with XRE-family HTH domain
MHAVARLVNDVATANGWNQAEVARRIHVSSSRMSQLLGKPILRLPNERTIESLSRGLGVPTWVVLDAYLESMGLPRRPNSVTIEDAVAADAHLSAADKRAILGFVTMQRQREPASVLDFFRDRGRNDLNGVPRDYLRPAGAAAREGEPPDAEPSDPDVTVDPRYSD